MRRYKGLWGFVRMIVDMIKNSDKVKNTINQIKDRKEISKRISNGEPYDDLIDESTDYGRALKEYAQKVENLNK